MALHEGLGKSFDDSSCAAACVGPKIFRPSARKASTTPAASGASGRPQSCRLFVLGQRKPLLDVVGQRILAVGFSSGAGIAGATITFCTRSLCASFQASACSRPPEPMTRTFMRPCVLVAEVTNAGGHHRNAAFVRRVDDFLIAHAAARLDHCDGARVGEHIETIAEREEGIAGATEPASVKPACSGLDLGDTCGSRRLIWPAPMPIVWPSLAKTMAFDLTKLRDGPNELHVLQLLRSRRLAGDDLQSADGSRRCVSALCTSRPPPTRFISIAAALSVEATQDHSQHPHIGLLREAVPMHRRCIPAQSALPGTAC